jgi:TPR repeat protein
MHVLLILIIASTSLLGRRPQSRGIIPEASQSGTATERGTYYALVIGINNYRDFSTLKTPRNDASEIAQVLRDRYGFVTKLLLDATRDQILGALDEYSGNLHEQDDLLIYYAGHGWSDKMADEAYWIPVDGQKDKRSHWITAADITDEARVIPARHVLIIADSCYSGMLAERDIQPIVGTPTQRDVLLERLLSGKSRHIISSGGDEPVQDSDIPGHNSNHSIFANALLQGLKQIDATEFTARELFDQYVYGQVGGQSRQLPEYNLIRNSGHNSGDFVFFRRTTAPAKLSPTPATPSGADVAGIVASAKGYYTAGQYERALPLFRSAAESGNAEAAVYVGYMHETGRGGLPKDDVQALSWYRGAAEAGDAQGMNNLGIMYRDGRGGLPKDDLQAVNWFRKAAEAGAPRGMSSLGFMYENGRGGLPKDDVQAVNWYRKAADAGDAEGMNNLGHMYERGQGGLRKDDVQAVNWYRKAADAGYAEGMNNLGVMYMDGRGGLPKDDVQAVSWYRRAADAGAPRGMCSLGFMYEHGRGGLPKDDAQAVRWYRKGAEAGDALGMNNLGIMYRDGRGGLPGDDVHAVSWFRKAVDAGEPRGMSSLGFMYENGRGGLPRDRAQAVYWYRKAASLGNEYAQKDLDRLGESVSP